MGVNKTDAQYYSKTMPNLPNFDKARYNFGFYIGGNQMLFTVKPVQNYQYITYHGRQISDLPADSARILGINGSSGLGFNVGLVSLLRFGQYFELRFVPGLQFGERNLKYSVLCYLNGVASEETVYKKVVSSYINVPFHLRYKAVRIHNFRPYIFMGPAFKWDLSSLRKQDDNVQNIRLKMSKGDVTFDVGVGFDIYTNWFKFGFQIEMSYGIQNILVKQNNIYASSIEPLYSKIFQINFTFE
jgi:hypothetical protein